MSEPQLPVAICAGLCPPRITQVEMQIRDLLGKIQNLELQVQQLQTVTWGGGATPKMDGLRGDLQMLAKKLGELLEELQHNREASSKDLAQIRADFAQALATLNGTLGAAQMRIGLVWAGISILLTAVVIPTVVVFIIKALPKLMVP